MNPSENEYELVTPSQVRVGDDIAWRHVSRPFTRMTVESIDGPVGALKPRQWVLHGPDENGKLRASTYGETEQFVRYIRPDAS